jgi:uncharacterized protein (DUF1800 family)
VTDFHICGKAFKGKKQVCHNCFTLTKIISGVAIMRFPLFILRRYVSFLLAAFLITSQISVQAQMPHKQNRTPAKALTSQQKAFHLLNRISYGPRPGDVDRVLSTGWEKYLDEQLHPERITDSVLEQKLKSIPSVRMDARQIAASYPPGNVVKRELEARGIDVAAARGQRKEIKGQAKADLNDAMPGAPAVASPDKPVSTDSKTVPANYRREILQIMQEKGWKPQQVALMEAQQAKILRAVYSQRQLEELLTDFWFNHFNVYSGKGPMRMMITPYERDTIRPLVFGKFEDLLRATAKSPAMLFYLDNWQSVAPDASVRGGLLRRSRLGNPKAVDRPFKNAFRRPGILNPQSGSSDSMQQPEQMISQPAKPRRGINENYAREIMELHTLGVDGGYTQKDVQEVARCLTGWTINQPNLGGGFYFAPRLHDDGEKIVLGKKIPAGGGINDGETVIRMLAHHPSTAKFIAKKLAVRFVSDNPSQALIDRTAQVFQKTDGDLREVVRSILTSPEFWSAENYRAKIKTPFELTVSAVRALGGETNGMPPLHRWIAQMGEGLYQAQPPTGYKDEADVWVNAGALLQRMNFALTVAGNRLPGTNVNLQPLTETTQALPSAGKVNQVVKLLLNGEMSQQTLATLNRQLNESHLTATDAKNTADADLVRIVGLVLGSPEFQRQ